MLESTVSLAGFQPRTARIIIFNLVMGVWALIRFTTPISWVGTWSDIVVDALCGLVVWRLFSLPAERERARRLIRISGIPAILLFGFPLLLNILFFIPPFTLGALFHWSEVNAEEILQSTDSPNQNWTAQVAFRPVGAYASGSGRTFVKLIPRWLPFLEWELYYNGRSYADIGDTDYAQWIDESRLYIPEAEQVFRITWWGIETEATP